MLLGMLVAAVAEEVMVVLFRTEDYCFLEGCVVGHSRPEVETVVRIGYFGSLTD